MQNAKFFAVKLRFGRDIGRGANLKSS